MTMSLGNSSMITKSIAFHLVASLSIAILFTCTPGSAHSGPASISNNVIDRCWRSNPNWRQNRQQLAMCSVGFSGKMTANTGRGTVWYTVTNPSDDPVSPRPGSLRYGVTMVKGKKWITFERDMNIKLAKPLLIGSFTTIDARGTTIHIAGGACLTVFEAVNVIIHGLNIHHCQPQTSSQVMGPDSKLVSLGPVDGDAIRVITSSKVWIDHNTLYQGHDGLLDVTRGSTGVTVSNNWFRDQDKVMLLGHDDSYTLDRNMKVTIIYNHFGPNCNQRMPRVRHGYAHVVNNLYQGWTQYAIGGSSGPSIKSEANLFIAPSNGRNKEVTWRQGVKSKERPWNFYSVSDVFENGASFAQTGSRGSAKPNYNNEQQFRVANGGSIRSITRSSGTLKCSKNLKC